jgi:hypothetical protein
VAERDKKDGIFMKADDFSQVSEERFGCGYFELFPNPPRKYFGRGGQSLVLGRLDLLGMQGIIF